MHYNGHRSAMVLTFDHEMCTNFPYRNSVWDHRKGQIDEETRAYTIGQNAIAEQYQVNLTYFLVASTLEDTDISYLQQMARAGHEIGNHTYSHVNVTATDVDDLQGIYARQPQLVGQRNPRTVICDELRVANELIKQKLGVKPIGFRTPYGFSDGLDRQLWLRTALREQGFLYASSRYNGWDLWDERLADASVEDTRLLADLLAAQPYTHSDGLWEYPIATPTDCHVFRPWRWPLHRWIELVKRLIDLSYEHGYLLDLCCHPSILAACDPEHATLATAIEHARSKTDGVWITTMGDLSRAQAIYPASSVAKPS
jgi:peptidoglycan/xylan/chitin deacetylase (PgdA/CDA1 family)